MVKIARSYDRQHGAKNLFLRQAMVRFDFGKDRRADKKASFGRLHLEHAFSLSFAEIDIAHDLRMRGGIDDRADEMTRIFWRTNFQALDGFHQTIQQLVVNLA